MQSTIDDSIPPTRTQVSSAPIRNNFAAAKADIEALELAPVFETPLTGTTLSALEAGGGYTLEPAADIAALTIVTPPNPRDGQSFEITTTATIASLTVSAAGGQTVKGGGPLTLGQDGGIAFRFRLSDTTWRRRW